MLNNNPIARPIKKRETQTRIMIAGEWQRDRKRDTAMEWRVGTTGREEKETIH